MSEESDIFDDDDNELANAEFDESKPYAKHRGASIPITYTQNGIVFSSGFVPLRYVDTPEPSKVKK